jgi:hypothetical protein
MGHLGQNAKVFVILNTNIQPSQLYSMEWSIKKINGNEKTLHITNHLSNKINHLEILAREDNQIQTLKLH